MSDTAQEYILSREDRFMAHEAYIRYLSGVAIVHSPETTQEIHTFDPKTDEAAILTVASRFIIAGLNDVVAYAQLPDKRTKIEMYRNFKSALPHMMDTVEDVKDNHYSRVQLLGGSVALMLPAPMLDETVYKLLCHANYRKLMFGRLLGPVMPAPNFREAVKSRLIDLSIGHRAA